jgi:hypothetical protein
MCLLFFEQADHKRDNSHDGENDEEDFGDFDSTSGNTSETEDGSNQCDNQKND